MRKRFASPLETEADGLTPFGTSTFIEGLTIDGVFPISAFRSTHEESPLQCVNEAAPSGRAGTRRVWAVVAFIMLVALAALGFSQRRGTSDLATTTEATQLDTMPVPADVHEKVRAVAWNSLVEPPPEHATIYRSTRGEAERAVSGAIVDSQDVPVYTVLVESPSRMTLRLRRGPSGSGILTGTIFSFTLRSDTLRVLDFGISDQLAVGIDPTWPRARVDLSPRPTEGNPAASVAPASPP
jgi:hypothetical protein